MLLLEELREAIDQKLSELLSETPHTLLQPLFDAARYSLLSPGKRLRPLLVLATAQIYEAPLEAALEPACALEIIHTYSLIHDDLPCMDDDDMRRGKPSLHKVYDEGHALLTGDFLLTYAFEILSRAPLLSAEIKLALIRTLAEAAGARGMIGGQVLDLASQTLLLDIGAITMIHQKKTAALFACALLFGGLIGKAAADDLDLLRKIGENLGSAFQIFDDLADNDAEECSCLKLLTPEQAEELAEEKFAQVVIDLSSLSKPAGPLEQLVDAMRKQFR